MLLSLKMLFKCYVTLRDLTSSYAMLNKSTHEMVRSGYLLNYARGVLHRPKVHRRFFLVHVLHIIP